ncbi:MAG: hypothetical protein IEMM0002_1404 [bacterium]|nr:MAG: hypothetical protein IEMM0002_1404 [bacterium]
MNNLKCPRCRSEFYSAISSQDTATCPYCGFFFNVLDQHRRREARNKIERECVLSRGDLRVTAHTLDISKCGIGLQMDGWIPFERNDSLHVVVKGFDIDSDGLVVWVTRSNGSGSKAGLRFC